MLPSNLYKKGFWPSMKVGNTAVAANVFRIILNIGTNQWKLFFQNGSKLLNLYCMILILTWASSTFKTIRKKFQLNFKYQEEVPLV